MIALNAVAQPDYYSMEKCNATESRVSVVFRGKFGEVRRFSLEESKIELGGDVKGSAKLQQIHELRVHPRLEVSYKGGSRVEFGFIPTECRERLRRLARSLSVSIGGTEG